MPTLMMLAVLGELLPPYKDLHWLSNYNIWLILVYFSGVKITMRTTEMSIQFKY